MYNGQRFPSGNRWNPNHYQNGNYRRDNRSRNWNQNRSRFDQYRFQNSYRNQNDYSRFQNANGYQQRNLSNNWDRSQSRIRSNDWDRSRSRNQNNNWARNQSRNRDGYYGNRNPSGNQTNNREMAQRRNSRNQSGNNWNRSRSRNQSSSRNRVNNRDWNQNRRDEGQRRTGKNKSNDRWSKKPWSKGGNGGTNERVEQPRSTNADFQSMCRALYKTIQVRHHRENWVELPKAIARNLADLEANITPPDPTNNLREKIHTIFDNASSEILACVQNHLEERLNFNRSFLRQINPQDKERAKEIVQKRLTQCLGKKIGQLNINTALNKELLNIGTGRQPPTRRQNEQTTDSGDTDEERNVWIRPRTKKTHYTNNATSPRTRENREQNPARTSNRFQSLADQAAIEELLTVQAEEPDSELEDDLIYETGAPNNELIIQAEIHAEEGLSQTFIVQEPALQPDRPRHPTTPPPDTSRNQRKKTRHSNPIKADWRVTLNEDTKVLVLTDSNFKYLPEDDIPPNWQVDIFPGASFSTLANVITKLPPNKIEHLVTSVGINNRKADFKKTTYREAGRVSEACATLTAQVHAVGISYSSDLQQSEQDNVSQINQRLRHIFASRYIKPLKPEDTITPEDDIHYNTETTKTIWKNIIEHVSERTKNQ